MGRLHLFLICVFAVCLISGSASAYIIRNNPTSYDDEDFLSDSINGESVVFDASEFNYRISSASIHTINPGCGVNYTVYAGSSSYVGWVYYDDVSHEITISFNGNSITYEKEPYLFLFYGPESVVISYAYDTETSNDGLAVYPLIGGIKSIPGTLTSEDIPFSWYDAEIDATKGVFSSISGIVNNPIYKFSALFTGEYSDYSGIGFYYGDTDHIIAALGDRGVIQNAGWKPITTLTEFAATTYTIVTTIIYWFKFVFIDHWLLVIYYYELVAIVLSIYAGSKKSQPFIKITTFFGTFWSYNEKLIRFLMFVIGKVVEVFTRIISAIGNLIPFT